MPSAPRACPKHNGSTYVAGAVGELSNADHVELSRPVTYHLSIRPIGSSFRWQGHSDGPVLGLGVNVTFIYLVLRISRAGTRPSGRRRYASEPKPRLGCGPALPRGGNHDLAVQESGSSG